MIYTLMRVLARTKSRTLLCNFLAFITLRRTLYSFVPMSDANSPIVDVSLLNTELAPRPSRGVSDGGVGGVFFVYARTCSKGCGHRGLCAIVNTTAD